MRQIKCGLLVLSFAFLAACNTHNADNPSNSAKDTADSGSLKSADSANRMAADPANANMPANANAPAIDTAVKSK